MSTTAESALQWLDEQQPDNQQIQDVIHKLKDRIQNSGADEQSLQGSIEALSLLEDVLSDRLNEKNHSGLEEDAPSGVSLDTGDLGSTSSQDTGFDSSPLGEPANSPIEHLTNEEKRQRFEHLKLKLNK